MVKKIDQYSCLFVVHKTGLENSLLSDMLLVINCLFHMVFVGYQEIHDPNIFGFIKIIVTSVTIMCRNDEFSSMMS
jgi:hypothetical protein